MSKCKRCAEHQQLKAEVEEQRDTIRYVTGQRDEAWSRQDAAVAERDALRGEIGDAWETAPDGYEADTLADLIKALAHVIKGEER